MKNLSLLCSLVLMSITAGAQQIHAGTMRLFMADHTSPVINVYDINKETLLKSINRGETVGRSNHLMCFNAEQSKLYALGRQFGLVIDVNTLDVQKIQLLSDGDTALQNIAKLQELNNAELERVNKEINGGNVEAKYTETPEIQKVKALPFSITPFGVTDKGVAVIVRSHGDKIEYTTYDLAHEGKKLNTFSLSTKNYRTFHEGNILQPEEDGSITVIDPLTGATIKKLQGAFDASALSEAHSKAAEKSDKKIYPTISSYGAYLCTQLSFGVVPNTAQMSYEIALYDVEAGKIVHTERVPQPLPEVLPVQGKSPHRLFQKVASKTPQPKLEIPPAPNYSKMKPADMVKALEEYPEQIKSAQGAWKIKHDEWSRPDNFVTRLFSDIACTQELLSVDAARYASITDDYLLFYKESAIEIYDIKTKKLLHTIYLV